VGQKQAQGGKEGRVMSSFLHLASAFDFLPVTPLAS
jgi:hypothetical protein